MPYELPNAIMIFAPVDFLCRSELLFKKLDERLYSGINRYVSKTAFNYKTLMSNFDKNDCSC